MKKLATNPRCPCCVLGRSIRRRVLDGRTGIVPYAPVPRLTTRLKLDGFHLGAFTMKWPCRYRMVRTVICCSNPLPPLAVPPRTPGS